MKARATIYFSIAGLLAIILIQLGGMSYAYKTQMKKSEQALNECFWMAFMDITEVMTNRLPYPDGTVVGMIACNKFRDIDNYVNDQMQRQVQTLQKVYHEKFRPAELDSLLYKRLSRVYIEGDICIERFNVHTGEVLESTNPDIHDGFAAICSEKAFTYKEKGEAVRAIVRFPFGKMMRNVVIMSVITLFLLAVVVFVLVLQMKSLAEQQHHLKEQEGDFYVLSEEMRRPVERISSKVPEQKWNEIEQDGNILLAMIEKMLSKMKAESLLKRAGKVSSLRMLSVVSLAGILLLLSIWSVYLYGIGYRKLEVQVEECFEEAFFREMFHHRAKKFVFEQGYKMPGKITGLSPYARRLLKVINEKDIKKKYNVRFYPVIIDRGEGDEYPVENIRLTTVYMLQDTINRCALPIPFSPEFADSVFTLVLREKGLPDKSSVCRMKYPSGEECIYTDSVGATMLDMSTRFFPLSKDSTYCVQGILHNPHGYIVSSIRYMLFPLGFTLLFMSGCVYFQVRISRTKRRLKQFQQDFTYSMIHDMKSPLSSVIMGAHVLAGGKLADKPEKAEKYKWAITDECVHLSVLLNRVLMLTQIDEGRLQLHKEEVSLRPLIDDLMAKALLKAGKKITFGAVFHRCETVWADAFCLHEVLSNLLDNAVKYSRQEVKIDIICEAEKGFCKIKVCDNGLGIPAKDLSRIFNRFERSAAAARSSKGGATGFGLGLNYVQQVMLAHEGRIEVESEEGSFSEFTLYFPMKA